jgi:hypothetical protein
MKLGINRIADDKKQFEMECGEQSTFCQALISVFQRYDLAEQPLRDWVNQKKEGHSVIEIVGPKYKATLIP